MLSSDAGIKRKGADQMREQLNKMLMDELLTDDQLKFYELTLREFHNPRGTVDRHSMALLLGYRDLKSKVEEMQKALEWYADEENYKRSENDHQTGYPHEIIWDKGIKARSVLKHLGLTVEGIGE